jgi:hypothetical protein
MNKSSHIAAILPTGSSFKYAINNFVFACVQNTLSFLKKSFNSCHNGGIQFLSFSYIFDEILKNIFKSFAFETVLILRFI